MPIAQHLTPRRVLLAAILLGVAAGLAAAALRSSRHKQSLVDKKPAERAAFDRIEVGMTSGEVEAILHGWRRVHQWEEFFGLTGDWEDDESWEAPNGVTVHVHFTNHRLRGKFFVEKATNHSEAR